MEIKTGIKELLKSNSVKIGLNLNQWSITERNAWDLSAIWI